MAGRSAQIPAVNNRAVGVAYILLGAFLLIYPWIASPFWTVQIGAQALILGVIALSVTLLAGYGGMVSLAQLSVAGCAGYMIAIWGFNDQKMGLGWPWLPTVLMAILIAVFFRYPDRSNIGAYRGYLYHHDNTCNQRGLLLFRQAELSDL